MGHKGGELDVVVQKKSGRLLTNGVSNLTS